MAITGLLLFGFVVAHLLGNLQLLAGSPDPINAYAAFLKGNPALLWSMRLGLLFVFVLHVVTGIRLTRANKAARPVAYCKAATIDASFASRSMALSGISLLVFVVLHLLHFTLGVIEPAAFAQQTRLDGAPVHHVYAMVTAGFAVPWIVIVYVASQLVLFLHLSHGIQSLCHTLGLHHARYTPMIRTLSIVFAAVLAGGNALLALSVMFGIVKEAA